MVGGKGRAMMMWFCLVFPSAFVVQKYLGWAGLAVYASVAAAGVVLLPKLTGRRSERTVRQLATATFLTLIVVFVVVSDRQHPAGHGNARRPRCRISSNRSAHLPGDAGVPGSGPRARADVRTRMSTVVPGINVVPGRCRIAA